MVSRCTIGAIAWLARNDVDLGQTRVGKGIDLLQVVGGRDLAAMFDCESSQMCIRREGACRATCDKEISQDCPVTAFRADQRNVRLREPIVDEANGPLD
jgi:hypothetical protein